MGYNNVHFALAPSDSVGFTESQRTAIELQTVVSISNEATHLYKNFKHPRYRNFYGYCQLMSGDFVVKDIALEYLNQEVLHWQQGQSDTLQSIGCAAKKILSALTPPSSATVDLYLLRQRYTGVRFRLMPGIEANISINWHFIEQLCDDVIHAPPEAQGNPPVPDNVPASPGTGRGDQPADLKAPSNNDGGFNPNDGKPSPPATPGSGTLAGQWYEVYSGYNSGCNGTYSGRRAKLEGATDGLVRPVWVRQGQGDCGPGSSYGYITYKGVEVDRPADVTSVAFDFVPG